MRGRTGCPSLMSRVYVCVYLGSGVYARLTAHGAYVSTSPRDMLASGVVCDTDARLRVCELVGCG